MKHTVISIILISLSGLSRGQSGPRPAPTNPNDLYRRLAASEHVVIGHLTGLQFVREIPSPEEREAHLKKPDAKNIRLGVIYSIAVDSFLCGKEDFLPGSAPAGGIREVQIVIPERQMFPYDGNPVELFVRDASYLLLLKLDPNRDDNVVRYGLDPGRPYYRAVEMNRGAIKLPAEAERGKADDRVTPFLVATTRLCEAVRPADTFQKVDKLRLLRTTGDDAMKKNAGAALLALTGQEN